MCWIYVISQFGLYLHSGSRFGIMYDSYLFLRIERCFFLFLLQLRIATEYTKVKYANLKAENQLIADKENHRYQIIAIGWEGNKFIHDCPIHMDIINGKIWIQHNMTEIDLGQVLTEMGVPKSDIVLGFLSPRVREYSDYAVA